MHILVGKSHLRGCATGETNGGGTQYGDTNNQLVFHLKTPE
jgi:hypothetical protein